MQVRPYFASSVIVLLASGCFEDPPAVSVGATTDDATGHASSTGSGPSVVSAASLDIVGSSTSSGTTGDDAGSSSENHSESQDTSPGTDTDASPGTDADTSPGTDTDASSGTDTEEAAVDWQSGYWPTPDVTPDAFGAWRGRPVEIVATWLGPDGILDSSVANWNGDADIHISFPEDGWQAAAEFDFTAIFRALESQRRGKGETFIRFAENFNCACVGWFVGSPELEVYTELEVYQQAWHNFHQAKEDAFPDAQLVWSPLANSSQLANIRDYLPGSPGAPLVDVIALVTQNSYPFEDDAAALEETWAATTNGEPLGLEAWRQFAESRGLPLAIASWGSPGTEMSEANGGGGDAPAYMEKMHGWVQAHAGDGPGNVLYELVFNGLDSSPGEELHPYRIFAGERDVPAPEAAETYRELW